MNGLDINFIPVTPNSMDHTDDERYMNQKADKTQQTTCPAALSSTDSRSTLLTPALSFCAMNILKLRVIGLETVAWPQPPCLSPGEILS